MFVSDLLRENIKQNCVGEVIERQSPSYPDTGRRQYHAVTRGWVANEIVRRVSQDQGTIGEFLLENVSKPLSARVFIGTEDEDFCPVKVTQGTNRPETNIDYNSDHECSLHSWTELHSKEARTIY